MSEQESWSPRDPKNPYRDTIGVWNTNEEWLEMARWYHFSVRVLIVPSSGGKAEWHEKARCKSWDDAKQIMELLGKSNDGNHRQGWVVMKLERRGKEGREKPVLFFPGRGSVLTTLRDLKMLPTSGGDDTDTKPQRDVYTRAIAALHTRRLTPDFMAKAERFIYSMPLEPRGYHCERCGCIACGVCGGCHLIEASEELSCSAYRTWRTNCWEWYQAYSEVQAILEADQKVQE